MSGKAVELAIFWLPIVAGSLLGSIAISAWYGGDKIPAIWIGFVGAVCFLLLGAIQLQQYAYANLLQPEISLIAPNDRTVLSWDPPARFNIAMRPENEQPSDRSASPIIVFENNGPVIGQDASIEWQMPAFDILETMSTSDRFADCKITTDGDGFIVGPNIIAGPTGLPYKARRIFKQNVQPIAFLGKRVESFIPIEVFYVASIYLIATLPNELGAKSQVLTLNATVRWNIPENSTPARFSVTLVASNLLVGTASKATAVVSIKAEKIM